MFGIGVDPRLALMLIEERDQVREQFYKPILEHRKSLMEIKVKVRERNHRIAQTMRTSLKQFKNWNYAVELPPSLASTY